VPLPKDLKPIHIARAVEYVETQTADLIDLYLGQANVFSAIVGIFGVRDFMRSAHTRNTNTRTLLNQAGSSLDRR
jgi:hypothetical protein